MKSTNMNNSVVCRLNQLPSKHPSWWRRLEYGRRLEDVFHHRLQKGSSRHLQDEYVRLTHTSSEDVFKTSSKRLDPEQHNRLDHTSSRRLQDVFKTYSRRLAKMSLKHLQDVFKTSLQDRFKTLSRCCKLFLLTRFQNDFEIYWKRFWDILQRRLSTEKFT